MCVLHRWITITYWGQQGGSVGRDWSLSPGRWKDRTRELRADSAVVLPPPYLPAFLSLVCVFRSQQLCHPLVRLLGPPRTRFAASDSALQAAWLHFPGFHTEWCLPVPVFVSLLPSAPHCDSCLCDRAFGCLCRSRCGAHFLTPQVNSVDDDIWD